MAATTHNSNVLYFSLPLLIVFQPALKNTSLMSFFTKTPPKPARFAFPPTFCLTVVSHLLPARLLQLPLSPQLLSPLHLPMLIDPNPCRNHRLPTLPPPSHPHPLR